jgi:type I restriction enzyme M protein
LSASEIVNKVWNYAHVLRDDGVGYGDYVGQITYLIFLKMADGLEGKPKRYGLSVTGNWRITFGWKGEDAIHLNLEDYH